MMVRTAMLIFAAITPAAAQQRIWAVRPEPGLVCRSAEVGAVIVERPDTKAERIGRADTVVMAVYPLRIINGFLEIERANRDVAWIREDQTSLFKDEANPNARCTPSLMSNGVIGRH